MINNPFGQDPIDSNETSAASRVGMRIRTIRMAKGMSLSELGAKVGLNADRMQKYENGARKPKSDMLKQIAGALGVSTLALTDPVTANYLGAMYAMFELEHTFNMKIEKTPEEHTPGYCLTVDFKENLYGYMEEWYKVYTQMRSDLEMATTDDERAAIEKAYRMWEWTYPSGIPDRSEKDLKKAQLKRKIEELQEAYDQLDQDDGKDSL